MYNPELSAQLHRQRSMELAMIERQIRSIEKETSADRSGKRAWFSRLRAFFNSQSPDLDQGDLFSNQQLQVN